VSRPLVPPPWRVAAWVAIAVGALGTGLLAVLLHHSAGTGFDRWVEDGVFAHVGSTGARFLLHASEPALSAGVIAVVAVIAGLTRRWALLALAVTAPLLAVFVTEGLLKPAVGRYMTARALPEPMTSHLLSGAFPSGHETGVAAAAVVIVVAAGHLRAPLFGRLGLGVALLGWLVLAALGLVRNQYHYATDTVGAVGVAVGTVLTTALLIDATAPAVVRSATRRRQFT